MLLKKGNTGSDVKFLQYGLHIMCCKPGSFDGDFGDATFEAVKQFQKKFNLEVDGKVGDSTWNTLSSNIKSIQTHLKNKGFNVGATDGTAGPNTYNAILAFQKANSLTQDGMVGPKTQTILFSSGYDDSEQPTLKTGSKGDAVKKLQKLLIAKGYSCGSAGADGDFGTSTYNAVISFQSDHNLTKDGIVGPATWAELNLTDNNNPILKTGSKGDAVTKLQKLLIAKGYSCGSAGADGDFGTGTYNAVISFQSDHNLTKDGIVGPATWDTLNSSSADEPILKSGCKGDAVIKLQKLLIAKGYSCGSAGADGDFGTGTYDAVTSFQADYNLIEDGIVGPATWYALNTNTKPATKPTTKPNNPSGVAGSNASANLIYFIKQCEGFAPSIYKDVVGVRTGGYGMTGNELNGLSSTISEATATSLLTKHVNNLYYKPVLQTLYNNGIKNPLQREVDAFTSFAYNNGVGAFKTSTLLKKYINGDRGTEIHNQLKRWVNAGGKVWPGLVNRREQEWRIFSGSTISVPGYNCRPSISYVNTSGYSTGKVVTDNNGYGANPY